MNRCHAGTCKSLVATLNLGCSRWAPWLFAMAATGAAAAATPQDERASAPSQAAAPVVEWLRAGVNTEHPQWGLRGGVKWGLPPRTGRLDGPRGLIRLRYPVLAGGVDDLINFIAVEPVVRGRKGFSELEHSELDGVMGKRLWVIEPDAEDTSEGGLLCPGQLSRPEPGVESLVVRVGVERFANGAHVTLTLTQRSDAPDELELTIHAEPDSSPLDYCILTATMGNKARTRQLWLKEEVANSLQLYADYRGSDFAPHRFFGLDRLYRNEAGEVLCAITTDETDPAAVEPFPGRTHWRFAGRPVTQYWRKPAGACRDDLHVAVNGRYTYWLSRQPIPGGIAFENFEMRERFYADQRFVFGITCKPPRELGFASPE